VGTTRPGRYTVPPASWRLAAIPTYGRVKLFQVDDGERWTYAATNAEDARRRHLATVGSDFDTPPEEWRVTEWPPERLHYTAGDLSRKDVPPGGRWDETPGEPGGLIVATSAQWAAKFEEHGGSTYAVFGSVW
jgi:hypothetical protein